MKTSALIQGTVAALMLLCGCVSQQPAKPRLDDSILTGVQVTASGSQNAQHDISKLIGPSWSRWVAAKGDNQWIEIKLAEPMEIKQLDIHFEAAFAKDYAVFAWVNNQWEKIFEAKDLKKRPNRKHKLLKTVTTDKLRLDLYKRGLSYPFSIYSIGINGKMLYGKLELVRDMSYLNPELAPEVRAERVLKQMTYEEKQAYTTGFCNFFISPLVRFGLRSVYMTDASCGVHIRDGIIDQDRSIGYPATVALAATWEPKLAAAYGGAIGSECRLLGTDVLLGPGVNLYRNSMCGRSFEYMGEDPFLVGTLVTEYIKALQGKGVIATGKHYICNNHEWLRHFSDVQIDDRTLRELYGRAWYRMVNEGKLAAVMSSYNLINGEKVSHNKQVLNGLLRDEMGFKGIIMSDWGAVWNSNIAAEAGLDLTMGAGFYHQPETEAGRQHLEALLDVMTKRILTTCFAFGIYDRPRKTPAFGENFSDYLDVALNTARRSVTLLKNEGNFLPIDPKAGKRILVIGLDYTPTSGGGSAEVKGFDRQNVIDELKKIYGADNVEYVRNPKDQELKNAAAIVAVVRSEDGEHNDKLFALSRKHDIELLNRATQLNNKVAVVLFSGRGVNMDGWGDRCAALLHGYYPGQTGAQAVAEIISGKVNPSGKLPFTIEKQFADSPAADYRPAQAGLSDQKKTAFEKSLPKFYPCPYKEGVFIGYRWYEQQNIKPRYAFGHGLSYTTFNYKDLKTEWKDGKLQATLTLTNTGKVDGAEVVQLYVKSPDYQVKRPLKELCAYEKIDLKAGESKTVTLTVHPEDLSYYDVQAKRWITLRGAYYVYVGSASDDIRLKGAFKVAQEQNYRIPVPQK